MPDFKLANAAERGADSGFHAFYAEPASAAAWPGSLEAWSGSVAPRPATAPSWPAPMPAWPAREPRVGLSPAAVRVKRAFDLLLASALLVASLPVAALIALLVKRSSPGPVLFRQTRVGRHGRHFEMLKFRTMVNGAHAMRAELMPGSEADGLFKIKRDPRLTRIGALLRQSYLDELPQLINVMRGEMSLVGPRPLIAEEDAAIRGSGRHRLRVPPGMTGEWQVLRGGGASLDEMIAADFRYVAEWSLLRDLRCLFKTAAYVVGFKGW